MRNLESQITGTIHSIPADQHTNEVCKATARTTCGLALASSRYEWTWGPVDCERCERRAAEQAPPLNVVHEATTGIVTDPQDGDVYRVEERGACIGWGVYLEGTWYSMPLSCTGRSHWDEGAVRWQHALDMLVGNEYRDEAEQPSFNMVVSGLRTNAEHMASEAGQEWAAAQRRTR